MGAAGEAIQTGRVILDCFVGFTSSQRRPMSRWPETIEQEDDMTIPREQCRAARILLNWSQLDLTRAAETAVSTIADFERGARNPRANTMTAIRAALETAGIVFIPGTATSGPGLYLRDPKKK